MSSRKAHARTLAVLAISALGLGAVPAAAQPGLRIQVVDQSGAPVGDAVVEVHLPERTAAPIRFAWRAAMAQKNLIFAPGTLIVAKGSTVAFPNLDQVRHSVYSFSKPARFNIDLYGRDQSRTQTFPVTGTVAIGCNIHDSMRGYIRVVDTPFAGKTDARGALALGGMPAGPVKITVWHPRLRTPSGEMTLSLKLGANELAQKIVVPLR